MTTNELIQQYKKEVCTNCKNHRKEFTQCSITIHKGNGIIRAGCDYYEPKGK